METPTPQFYVTPKSSPERDAFNGRLATKNAAPLWNVLGAIVPKEPQTPVLPSLAGTGGCGLFAAGIVLTPLPESVVGVITNLHQQAHIV